MSRFSSGQKDGAQQRVEIHGAWLVDVAKRMTIASSFFRAGAKRTGARPMMP